MAGPQPWGEELILTDHSPRSSSTAAASPACPWARLSGWLDRGDGNRTVEENRGATLQSPVFLLHLATFPAQYQEEEACENTKNQAAGGRALLLSLWLLCPLICHVYLHCDQPWLPTHWLSSLHHCHYCQQHCHHHHLLPSGTYTLSHMESSLPEPFIMSQNASNWPTCSKVELGDTMEQLRLKFLILCF